MRTAIRRKKTCYLDDTMTSLIKGGVFTSPLLGHFAVYDTKVPFPLNPNRNALRCLQEAMLQEGEWVIFMEDDIHVISHFLEGVDQWLSDCGEVGLFFPLGANYKAIMECTDFWEYPLDLFYGTQAYCLRKRDLPSLIEYIIQNTKTLRTGHDKIIQWWAQSRGVTHVRTPCPSFVQHTGVDSSLTHGKFFTFESWPGEDYEYGGKQE